MGRKQLRFPFIWWPYQSWSTFSWPVITLSWPYLRGLRVIGAYVQLLDATSEPLWVRNYLMLHFIFERWIIFSQETPLPFGTHPQSSPQSVCDVCDGEKRFDPSRLKPLDPQKHHGEVMIGALIGASHWGLKAHRGHVSFGSQALPTLPQIHLPPDTTHVHQGVSEWRREKKRASLQI